VNKMKRFQDFERLQMAFRGYMALMVSEYNGRGFGYMGGLDCFYSCTRYRDSPLPTYPSTSVPFQQSGTSSSPLSFNPHQSLVPFLSPLSGTTRSFSVERGLLSLPEKPSFLELEAKVAQKNCIQTHRLYLFLSSTPFCREKSRSFELARSKYPAENW